MLKILVTGALYNILNIVVQILLGLLVFREMLLHFGEADFGVWSFLFAMFAHVSLFEFGLGSIISKLVPILKKGGNENTSYFSTAVASMLIIFFIFLIVLIVVSLIFEQELLEFESNQSFSLIFFLIGCNFLFLFLIGAFHAYLTGNFKLGRLNSVRLFINVLRGITVIVFLQLDYSVLAIAIIFATTSLLELLLLCKMSLSIGLLNDLDFRSCSFKSFKYVADRGYKLFFLSVNNYTRQNASIIICGLMVGVVAIVPLRIAGRLMEIYVQISVSLNSLLTPYFSSISFDDSINRKFLISINCATALSSVILFNIFYIGDWFLLFWLGDVPDFTSEILQLMAIGFCVATIQGPCISFLISRDKNKTLMSLCILEIATLLILIFPMVERFEVIGAAYAVVTSLLVSRGIFQPIVMSKVLNINLLIYYTNLIVLPVLLGLTLKIMHLSASSLDFADENITVLLFVTMQGTVALGALLIFKVRNAKRNRSLGAH